MSKNVGETMRVRPWLGALTLFLAGALCLAWLGGAAAPAAATESLLGTVTVRISPASKTVAIGQDFTVDVYADAGANQVYGVECDIVFNTTYLNVQSITNGTALPTILAGTGVSGGKASYRAGVNPGSPPVTGTFKLFTLNIHANAAVASTPLDINYLLVAGVGGSSHTGVAQDGTVVILAATSTPTRTNTPVMTAVPTPTSTNTPGEKIAELVIQEDVDGYTGFEDPYVDAWNTTSNYSADPSLKLRSGNLKNNLLRADLSEVLPPGTVIEEAVLTLYQTGGSHNTIDSATYGVIRDWSVSQATWISATQAIQWGMSGCSAAGTDRDSDVTFTRPVFPTWGRYFNYPFDFTITALVQRWINDPVSNEGLVITAGEGSASEFNFASSDNADVTIPPRLLIRYNTGPTPTPSPTVTGTPPTPTPTRTVFQTPTVTPTPMTSSFGVLQDTHISSWDQTGNFGTAVEMQIRSGGVKHALVQFDLSSLPVEATIYEAKLRLYSNTSGVAAAQVAAHGLKRAWGEYEATWNLAQSGVNWGSRGAASTMADRESLAADTQTVSGAGWVEWDVTDLAQAWVSDPTQNFGAILIGQPGTAVEYKFQARERTPDSNDPQLVVRWLVKEPEPTVTPTATWTPEGPTPTATWTPSYEGTVEGYAFVDENLNTQHDLGEPGVQGVTVQLRSYPAAGYNETRLTDSTGYYLFSALTPGQYRVQLSALPSGYEEIDPLTLVISVSAGGSEEVNFALRSLGGGRVALPVILK